MANSSDWIAQVGGGSGIGTNATQPGWIAELALSDTQVRGFRDISPFALPGTPLPTAPPGGLHEDAEAQAYRRGLADGEAQAAQSADAALIESREQYRRLRLAFQTLDAGARDALAGDLNATVLALCAQVLGDYALDRDNLLARCHAAAARLGGGPGGLTLTLHPETRALLDEGTLAGWTLGEDATLAPGSLRLTGPDGSAREGPEDWSRAIAEALGN